MNDFVRAFLVIVLFVGAFLLMGNFLIFAGVIFLLVAHGLEYDHITAFKKLRPKGDASHPRDNSDD